MEKAHLQRRLPKKRGVRVQEVVEHRGRPGEQEVGS
jgi:hypothetical protein